MGLDMYLFRKNKKTNETQEVAYWRKFNALHHWFVENIQNGTDDCEPSQPINDEEIYNLLNLLKSLDKKNCKKLLPTTRGFFFGSTEYDGDYWDDVRDAIEQIEKITDDFNFEENDLIYQSSW
jgi:hypothetical protein